MCSTQESELTFRTSRGRYRPPPSMTMPTTRTIPVDEAKAADATITDAEWAQTDSAHERFRTLVETKPRAKARHDAVLTEINGRQATLRRLREARALTQSTVGDLLDMDQSEVSRLSGEAIRPGHWRRAAHRRELSRRRSGRTPRWRRGGSMVPDLTACAGPRWRSRRTTGRPDGQGPDGARAHPRSDLFSSI